MGQQVGVHVQGERGARMPEHLRHDFRLNAGGERERRSRVTEVVESEVGGQLCRVQHADEVLLRNIALVKGLARSGRED